MMKIETEKVHAEIKQWYLAQNGIVELGDATLEVSTREPGSFRVTYEDSFGTSVDYVLARDGKIEYDDVANVTRTIFDFIEGDGDVIDAAIFEGRSILLYDVEGNAYRATVRPVKAESIREDM